MNIGTDFTTGGIPKKMLSFSIPYMFASAFQVVYSLVDMIIVGHFVGSNALSAVSIASQLIMFFTTFCLGYASGGQIYISQVLGSGKREKLNAAIGTLTTVTAAMAVAATVICLVFRNFELSLLNTPAEARGLAEDYLVVCGFGLVFTYGYNLVTSILRGMGESKKPLYFIIIATIVNVVLDLLFVGAFQWKTMGAALATVIGQAVSFVTAVIYLYRHREQLGFDFKWKSFRIERHAATEITKLGGVSVVQCCVVYISMMFVNALVNKEGVYASAAFGVGMKLDDLITKVTFGINVATATMVGQNFAAGAHGRVKKTVHTSWLFAGTCYFIFGCVYLSFGKQMFGMFSSDARVIALAPLYIRASLCSFPGFVIMRGTNGLIQGTGFARLGFFAGMLDALILRIGMSYFFGIIMGMGLFGFFLGYAIAVYGSALPGLIYYISGKWRNRRLLV